MITEVINVKELINSSINKGISYNKYRALIEELVESNSTTGDLKTEDLVNYTKLNDRRMRRWDKTVKVTPEHEAIIKSYEKPTTWLVITESWCGDAAHVNPVISKVAELNSNIDLKFVLRDENPDLMDAFLTNGGRAIPKLIMIDNASGEVSKTFGPRPSIATQMVVDYKTEYGMLTPEFKEDLQLWYNKNKGQNIIDDLVNLLK
ncbi:MAG: thioredoxin family protein [Flavobacteriaceae bacterium]|nr:thioredoxin family protein [Flavobacteriaceae bacterium]